MGFWSKFADIWKNPLSMKAYEDTARGTVADLGTAAKSVWSGLFNVVGSAFNEQDGSDQLHAGLQDFGKWASSMGSAGASLASLTSQAPVVKQTFNSLLYLGHETVGRGLGAAGLRLADDLGGQKPEWENEPAFSGAEISGLADSWRQAYNQTENVSTGQAWTYAIGQTHLPLGGVLTADALAKGIEDPRTPEGQKSFHEGWSGQQLLSGTTDAAVVMYADPTALLGPEVKAAKLKFISKPMTEAALTNPAALAAERQWASGPAVDKLHDLYRNSGITEDTARQLVFNKVPRGGQVNGVLMDAAKLDDDVQSRQVFGDVLLAYRGDPDAQARLVEAVPDIGRSIVNKQIQVRRANLVDRLGEGNPELEEELQRSVASLRETDFEAMQAAASQGRGIYGRVYGAGIGQNRPRLSLTSKWRVGMHQTFNGDPAVMLAPKDAVARANPRTTGFLRRFTPSATTTRIIDFDDPNLAPFMRSNWESARLLPAQRISELTTMYDRASNRNARFMIFKEANQEIAKAEALKHGYSEEDFERVIPQINQLHATALSAFSQTRRFMPEELRKFANDLMDRGDEIAAQRAQQMADETEAAVGRGDQPRSMMAMVDMDGNTIVYPDGWDPAEVPLLTSQQAAIAPQTDWRLFDHALRWHKDGPLVKGRRTAYRVYDGSVALADAVNSAWKVGTLARLGLMWRGPSDEIARAAAMYGAAHVMQASLPGVVDAARTSLANRVDKLGTRLQADKVRIDRTRRGLDTHDPATADVESAAPAVSPLADEDNGVPRYRTIEAQVVDGIIPVNTYLDHVVDMADNQPGELHPDLAMMVQARRDGNLTPQEFAHHAVEHALATHSRDSYVMPNWRQSVLDQVNANHVVRKVGEDAKPVVIDPFSGLSPEAQDSASYRLSKRVALDPNNETEHMLAWIRQNHDELLKPDTVMHVVVSRSGRIAVSAAKSRLVDEAVKPSGGTRLRIQRLSNWLRPGAQGLRVDTEHGPVMLDSWSEGGQGQQFKGQVAAAGDRGQSWAERVQNQTYAELLHATRNSWQDVYSNQQGYGNAWERAVNDQLANDAVARKFIGDTKNGKPATVSDVLQWMYGTRDGRAYYEAMGPWQARAVDQVQIVQAMVNHFLPDDGSGAAKLMRRKALAHEATAFGTKDNPGNLESVVKDKGDMPTVHGGALDLAVGRTFKDKANKFINGMFHVLQDKPADFFARYPLAKLSYDTHATEIMRVLSKQHAFTGREFIPVEWKERVQEMARERALADVRKYMYDAATTHNLAKVGRFVVPFASAAIDSYIKWGTIFKEKPWTAYQMWKLWSSPDRAGLIQDENGYHLKVKDGVAHWYAVDPETHAETEVPASKAGKERLVHFLLPSTMQPKALGGQASLSFNKDLFNTMLTMPTAGPMVAIPASNFSMKHPEFAENKFVKTFILPFGPQADWKQFVIPGSMRSAWEYFNGQEGDTAQYQATAIMQTELVRHAQGLRSTQPTYAEVREKANQLRGIRFLYQFAGLSPQFNTPYELFVDQYRQMKANEGARKAVDPSYSADTDFYMQHGAELYYLTQAVTRNRAGVPATIGGQKAYEKSKKVIDANPDIANWIIGKAGAGAFSQAVYQNQLNQAAAPGSTDKMRYRMGLQESTEDVAQSLGWQKWDRLQSAIDLDLEARGLDNINQPGAEDLKTARDNFVKANMYWDDPAGGKQLSPWYKDYTSQDKSRVTGRLTQFANVIKDPLLSQRDDAQGMAQYLVARQQMRSIMKQNNLATLNSKKAAPFLSMWQQYVQGLKANNLSFASTYNYWLSGDQYLDAPFDLEDVG